MAKVRATARRKVNSAEAKRGGRNFVEYATGELQAVRIAASARESGSSAPHREQT
jgi:hypothetical protein